VVAMAQGGGDVEVAAMATWIVMVGLVTVG
jgi:hypothetical protein